jgi:hypothetical protein
MLEAAEVVGAEGDTEQGDVFDLLSRLVDKSLVVAEATGDGGLRYRMLEPIRQYAQEKLEERGEAEEVNRRHASLFLALAEDAESKLQGPEDVEWLERLEVEHDNMRAALSWARERGEDEVALRLAGALGWFWESHGHYSEGRRWLQTAKPVVGRWGLADPADFSASREGKLAFVSRDVYPPLLDVVVRKVCAGSLRRRFVGQWVSSMHDPANGLPRIPISTRFGE